MGSADLLSVAKKRMDALAAIRLFFVNRGYVEVEAPLLVASPDMEPTLTPLEVGLPVAGTGALITSPEYSMKKLLGQGFSNIFFLGKVFRGEEVWDDTHVSEFTMLEWYEGGMEYRAGMGVTEELVRAVAKTLGVTDHPLLLPWKKERIEEAFHRELALAHVGELDLVTLRASAETRGVHTTDDDTWSDVFYRLYTLFIEPRLPEDQATILYDYPKPQAALSRLCPDGIYAERFELFAGRLELCNAFTELTDAEEQRRRFQAERDERRRLRKTLFPIDEELLALLPSVPRPTFGNALGVDRLLQTLLGADAINDILLFPPARLFRDHLI